MTARRWLALVLPGLPQLLAGRRVAGGAILLVWLSQVAILGGRWDRVRSAAFGDLGERLSVIALLAVLVGVTVWSLRSAGVQPDSERHRSGDWGMTVRAFSRNRLAVTGLALIAGAFLLAALAPLIAPYDPEWIPLQQPRLESPSLSHLLGTDHQSRDVLSRLLYGARISLSIGILAVGISVSIGTLLGAAAGFLGGWVDVVIMRFVDVVLSFPRLILILAVVALFSPSMFLIVVVLGLTQWPITARFVRGEVLSLREREYISAARALGFTRSRIVLRHVIPNALTPVIVSAALGVGDTIILEAGLSYLGLGVQAPTASWGTMLNAGSDYIVSAWWMATFPGLAIVLTVVAFTLVGDGLTDALDPRRR